MNEQPKNYINEDGDKFWYLPSKRKYCYHRLDGPAVEWENGSKEWYVEGNRHRLDGPAIEHKGGTKWWYVDGKRHRLDGPAIEHEGGTKWWYVDDKLLPMEEVEEWLEENNIDLKTEEGQMAFTLRWT